MRILVIDAGNTSTGVGIYQSGEIVDSVHVTGGIRMNPAECADFVINAARRGINGAVLGSVVPRVNQRWIKLIQRELGVELLIVNALLPMDITLDYSQPEQIGADRLADACGGVARYGAPLIVADFGTALTFDVIMPDKRYIGGRSLRASL